MWPGRDPNGTPGFRAALKGFLGDPPAGGKYDAHHVFPVKWGQRFWDAGINANDAKYGSWVPSYNHSVMSTAYNREWEVFFRQNPAADMPQILNYGRALAAEYHFDVHY